MGPTGHLDQLLDSGFLESKASWRIPSAKAGTASIIGPFFPILIHLVFMRYDDMTIWQRSHCHVFDTMEDASLTSCLHMLRTIHLYICSSMVHQSIIRYWWPDDTVPYHAISSSVMFCFVSVTFQTFQLCCGMCGIVPSVLYTLMHGKSAIRFAGCIFCKSK